VEPKIKREFRQLFGFEVEGIDYGEPVEIDRQLEGPELRPSRP
jgi:trans-2-enoyl-CoA reductase